MSQPKVNPEVALPPATHTAEAANTMPISKGFVGLQEAAGFLPLPVPPGGMVRVEGDPRSYTFTPKANGALAAALAKAQGEMKAAVYNKVNPHFKNKYADLAAVLDVIRAPLAKYGIGRTQIMEMEPEFRLVTTLHYGGETISSYYPLPVGAKPQELGSALTYARRYSLSAICGIAADEDDDAEAATQAQAKVTPEQVEHLQILLEDMPEDTEARLLAYMGKLLKRDVKAIADIPHDQFPTAFAVLEKKRKEKPKEAPKP